MDRVLLCREILEKVNLIQSNIQITEGQRHGSPGIQPQGIQLPSPGLWCSLEGGQDQPEELAELSREEKHEQD